MFSESFHMWLFNYQDDKKVILKAPLNQFYCPVTKPTLFEFI